MRRRERVWDRRFWSMRIALRFCEWTSWFVGFYLLWPCPFPALVVRIGPFALELGIKRREGR